MALSDLSYITRTYIDLLTKAVNSSGAFGAGKPDVLPLSPTSLPPGAIGFYLYHVLQKKEHDNFAMPARQPEIRFLPMSLVLYYQLTARCKKDDKNGTYTEQQMMSVAMKALHDCPLIEDATLIGGASILRPEIMGMNNRFKIIQQPIQYSEAVHNWTAGQQPLKLSAYYEVSTAFLDPDELKSRSGRVLAYGNYIFANGAPRITGCQSIVEYTVPGEAKRAMKVQPAQASPANVLPAAIGNQVTFYGEGFEGDETQLCLISSWWTSTIIADADWELALISAGELNITIRENALNETTALPVAVVPGNYAAQVRVGRTIKLDNGTFQTLKHASNQFPFVIAPRLDPIPGPVAGVVTITGYCFKHVVAGTDFLAGKIDVYLGETKQVRNDLTVILAGQFKVVDASTIRIKLPAAYSAGDVVPLRIFVNGAESAPNWIVV